MKLVELAKCVEVKSEKSRVAFATRTVLSYLSNFLLKTFKKGNLCRVGCRQKKFSNFSKM